MRNLLDYGEDVYLTDSMSDAEHDAEFGDPAAEIELLVEQGVDREDAEAIVQSSVRARTW